MHFGSAGTQSTPFGLVVDETGESILAAWHSIELPDGRRLEVCLQADETDDISGSIVRGHYQIPAHYRLLDALVPPRGRVIDLGAHVGTFALYAAASGHEVIAVDASKRNIALLRESVRRNGFNRVHVVHAAVSDHPGHVEFTEFGAYGIVANELLQWPTKRVPAIVVDSLLADLGWESSSFVKMDIEGSEPTALRGMAQLLSRDHAPDVMFESNGHTLHLFEQTPNALLEILERAGYRSWLIRDRQLFPVGSADLQYECVVDYLALKREVPPLQGWGFGPRISPEAQFDKALASSRHANSHVRAHVARTLRSAQLGFRKDPRIDSALRTLAQDAEQSVREAAAWYHRGGSE